MKTLITSLLLTMFLFGCGKPDATSIQVIGYWTITSTASTSGTKTTEVLFFGVGGGATDTKKVAGNPDQVTNNSWTADNVNHTISINGGALSVSFPDDLHMTLGGNTYLRTAN